MVDAEHRTLVAALDRHDAEALGVLDRHLRPCPKWSRHPTGTDPGNLGDQRTRSRE
ncbi:hypothetical protein OG439_12490 [Amycolatopsis sp. NBC_01307]|uniref:hypothetical protein n=1 Tax=Amycolatopsis sp. NBC_01307 TaxID=2903561 RepID=UPI002E0FE91F|nr:hypothetical protein OG439_12490 [Amycolatopsis sp. NBC_01307]